jgi:hypothetical protein
MGFAGPRRRRGGDSYWFPGRSFCLESTVGRFRRIVQKAKTAVRRASSDAKFVMYYELLEAFREPGCPVCARLEQGSLRAMDGLLYEQVTDPATRARLLASRGFCNRHAWMLPRIQSSPLGTAVIYHHLLASALERATADGTRLRPRSWWQRLSERIAPRTEPLALVDWWNARTECSLCVRNRQSERDHLAAMLGFVQEKEFLEGLRASAGLCLPHLCHAMTIGRDHPNLAVLLSVQADRWSDLVGELAEFIRKNDYRFATEAMGREGDSWQRVLDAIAGRNGAFAPDAPHGTLPGAPGRAASGGKK